MSPFFSRRRPNDELRAQRGVRRSQSRRLVPIDEIRAVGDPEVARVATIQRGAITTRQLNAAGISDDTITRRERAELLHRQFRGVYLVGHEEAAELAPETCALLAVGADALLSHWTAARIWRIYMPLRKEVHVLVPGRRPRSQKGIDVHTTSGLDPLDRAVLHGLPLTAAARTVVDLSLSLSAKELERALAEGIALKCFRVPEVEAAMERATDRRGLGRLGDVIGTEPQDARSKAEEILHALIRSSGLEKPDHANYDIGPWNVDLVWLRERVVVELDTYGFHSSPWAFERDRRKTIWLEARGWKVIRITYRQLTREPEFVVATIAQALQARSSSIGGAVG